MRQKQCDKCKHYALYEMPAANKIICANCKRETARLLTLTPQPIDIKINLR